MQWRQWTLSQNGPLGNTNPKWTEELQQRLKSEWLSIWYYLVLFGSLMQFRRCKFGYFGILNSVIEMFALRPSCFWLLLSLRFQRFQRFQLRFSGQHDGLMSRITNPNLEAPSFWTKFQTRHQLNLEPVSGHAQMMSSTEHSIMINTTSIVYMVCPYRDSQMLLSPQCQFVCLLLKCTIWRVQASLKL